MTPRDYSDRQLAFAAAGLLESTGQTADAAIAAELRRRAETRLPRDIELVTGWLLRLEPIDGTVVRAKLARILHVSVSRDAAEAVESASSFLRVRGYGADALGLERGFADERGEATALLPGRGTNNGGGR